MSDRPESDATTRSQRFLQHRVAQFGKVAGLAGLAFWAFNGIGHLHVGGVAALFGPSMNFHLLGAASLLAVWVLCGGRPRSRLFVQVVEGAGLMGSSVGYSLMGSHLPVLVLRPDLIVVLAMTFGMVVPAVFVPSPAARTAVLTALVGVPVVVGNHLGVQRESFAVLQQFVPYSLSLAVTVESAVWWTMTVAVCTVTSNVLYGLRREVRKARQLGQYLLEEKLGEGGMGVVYRPGTPCSGVPRR